MIKKNVLTPAKKTSKSQKANLTFSVARIHRYLKKSQFLKNRRLSTGAAVYLTAVLEYLTREVIEFAGQNAKKAKKKLISPRHILLAISADQEIQQAIPGIIIPQGGVLPKISPQSVRSISSRPKLPHALNRTNNYSLLHERTFERGRRLCIVKGDITELDIEAIVHPTSSNFSTRGMVGSALASKGSTPFLEDLNNLKVMGPLQNLDAKISKAFGIKAKAVIHVNGPSYKKIKGHNNIKDLETAVKNCLDLANSRGLKSVGFPSMGSGNAGFPKQLAAQTLLRVIREYLRDCTLTCGLEFTYFVLFDDDLVKIYKEELQNLH